LVSEECGPPGSPGRLFFCISGKVFIVPYAIAMGFIMTDLRPNKTKILGAMILALMMGAPLVPAAGPEMTGHVTLPRTVTDTASDLIVPAGETYEIWGCHTYTNTITIDGVLNVKPYDGVDDSSGTLTLKARSIIINSTGKIAADGRGYGGGGGGSSDANSVPGGKTGVNGIGGSGAAATLKGAPSTNGGGGGGGSIGGIGGTGYAKGGDGTATGGGAGANSATNKGGVGGPGFGGGGGGGAGEGVISGGGGGAGGCGGSDSPSASGGNGGGSFGGVAGPSTATACAAAQNGKDGGYLAPIANGDTSTDIGVFRGGGGGGGGASTGNGGGAGGGGAGGGAVTLVSDGELVIMGTISSTGSGGGKGGVSASGIIPDDKARPPLPRKPTSNTGGSGGSGSGGGIALVGDIIRIGGTVNALGKLQGVASSINGGTIKLFQSELQINGTLAAGRNYTNGRPVMKGLLSPANMSYFNIPPELSWNAAQDPENENVTYQLLVAPTSDFAAPVLDKGGLANMKFKPSLALAENTYYWKVRAWDAVGPGRWSAASYFVVDSTPPESAVKPLAKYTTTVDFQVAWNGTDNCAGISDYTIYFSDTEGNFRAWKGPTYETSGLFNGVDGSTFRFYSMARDKASNAEADPGQPDAMTTVDASPPVSSISALAPFQPSEDFTVSWSGKDNTSGITGFTVHVSDDGGAFSVWQDGVTTPSAKYSGEDGHEYRFYVIARDQAGFSESEPEPGSTRIVATRVDMNAPATTMSLAGAQYGKDPVFIGPSTKVDLQASDSFSGVGITQYKIDDGTPQKYQSPFKVEGPGDHNLTFWSLDRAQNREPDQMVWLSVDGDPPFTVMRTEGPSFEKNNRMYITPMTKIGLVATDNGSGMARTEYSLDGAAFQEYTRPFSLDKTGNHTIRFHGIDNLGTKEADRSQLLEVDTSPPRTTAQEDLDLEANALTVALKSDDSQSGVASIFYRVLEGKGVSQDWTPGQSAVIGVPDDHSGDGKYKVEYYSVDNLGNREETRSLDLTIDTVVELTVDQAENITVARDSFTFTGKAEKGCKVTVNGDAVQIAADGTFSIELPLHEGQNEIEVRATDDAGNTKTTKHFVTYNVPESGSGNMLPLVAVGALVAIAAIAALLFFRRKGDNVKAPARAARGAPAKKTVKRAGKQVKR